MNYEELEKLARAYADRQDLEVEEMVPDFVTLAEARINRLLKVRGQTHRIQTPAFTGYSFYALPNDYAGMRHIKYGNTGIDNVSGHIQSSSVPGDDIIRGSLSSMHHSSDLFYLPPEAIDAKKDSGVSDGRIYYTIVANQIEIYPTISSNNVIEAVYYRKVPKLTAISGSTNWLLTDYPDIYLAAVVLEIELFVKNYSVVDLWETRLANHIDELKNDDVLERWAGGSLVMTTY